MHYDDILKRIGEFGRYQIFKYLLVCFVGLANAFQALVSVFTLATPKHRCALPSNLLNGSDTWIIQSAAHEQLISQYIPLTNTGSYESCKLYLNGLNTTMDCNEWVYDPSERLDTIVTKMDLVCGGNLKGTLATTMYMVGNLVGSMICGIISDNFGRRIALLTGIIGQFLSGMVLAFTPEFYSFVIFRFFVGIFNMQVFLAAFVLGMEIVGPSYRIVAGMVIEIFWAIGFLVLIGLAYAIRTETYLQLTITLPILLFIPYYWILPESPRWLLAKGRTVEAEKIVEDIAKTNGRSLPDEFKLEDDVKVKPEHITALRRAPRLLIRILVIFFNWFVISMSYYGLSLNSGNMPGSLYVNMTLSAAGELLGYFLCFLCFVLGRKIPHVGGMIIGGVACIGSVAVYYLFHGDEDTKNWIFVGLNTVGKIGVTMGFAIIYLWSAEIFPTLLRNSLMGGSSVCARLGSIMAPVIADIGKIVPANLSQMLPPLIFGVFTISGGLLSILLPETNRADLPETIAEANVFPNEIPERSDDQELSDVDKKF